MVIKKEEIKNTNRHVLLYDDQRDKDLKLGETLLVYEDGTTEKVREEALYKEQEVTPSASEGKESWSTGGQIYFLDGQAWGLNKELESICLGTEVAVRAALDNPKLKCGSPEIDGVIALEREVLRKEKESYGKRPEGNVNLRASKSSRPDSKRVRPMSTSRRIRNYTGQSKARKRTPLHRT